MKIKVMYHSAASAPISQANPTDWCDLKTAKDVTLKQGERAYIDLGVSIQLPEGYEAIMAPRSSTFKNYGILQTNGIGVFDLDFNGPDDHWMFAAYATRDVFIPAGSRISQFRIQPVQGLLTIEEEDLSDNKSRGGLGSTGL